MVREEESGYFVFISSFNVDFYKTILTVVLRDVKVHNAIFNKNDNNKLFS